MAMLALKDILLSKKFLHIYIKISALVRGGVEGWTVAHPIIGHHTSKAAKKTRFAHPI